MGYRRKTWQEKLADKDGYPKTLTLQASFPCYKAAYKMGVQAGDKIVLVNPSEVVALMKKVPMGRIVTITEICRNLANKHQVEGCCSLTAGIFIMTAAHAAEEALRQGQDLEIQYWRTLKVGGFLNEKFPGGAAAQRLLLEYEGIPVASRGKRLFVENFQAFVYQF